MPTLYGGSRSASFLARPHEVREDLLQVHRPATNNPYVLRGECFCGLPRRVGEDAGRAPPPSTTATIPRMSPSGSLSTQKVFHPSRSASFSWRPRRLPSTR